MITLFVIISWKYFGFHMILLLAGLQGIPKEIEEAALIDGAGRWQAFRYVTLPLLGPTLRVSVFLSIIGALQLFDMVWVMTGGGPLNASTTMADQHVQDRLREAADGLRQRARRDPVPVRPRRRPRCTSGSCSGATSTAPSPPTTGEPMTTDASTGVSADADRPSWPWPAPRRAPHDRRDASRYVVLLAVAAAILIPIVYAVLGGFKTNGQLGGEPGGAHPRPVGLRQLRRRPRGARTPRRSGASSSTA